VPVGFFGPGLGNKIVPRAPGPQVGPGGPGFPAPRLRAFPGPGLFPGGVQLGAAASYLGLTVPQLFQKLSSGKSLAEVAAAQHKSTSGLEQAMAASLKSRLEKLVTAKVITSAREQQILSQSQKLIARQINQKGLQVPKFRAPALRFRGGSMAAPPNTPSAPKGPNGQLGPASQLFAPAGPSA